MTERDRISVVFFLVGFASVVAGIALTFGGGPAVIGLGAGLIILAVLGAS